MNSDKFVPINLMSETERYPKVLSTATLKSSVTHLPHEIAEETLSGAVLKSIADATAIATIIHTVTGKEVVEVDMETRY